METGTVHVGRHWHPLPDSGGRIECDVCPNHCRLKPGQRGACFVRRNEGGRMVLTTYGRSSGFCIDPIEKKPLNHFLPGTPVLSFGTAGCNLACAFCQNWEISRSREMDRLMERAEPSEIVAAARRTGCRSVAFTYNDPVVFLEYAVDTARACREAGVHPVAVTAGYIEEEARRELFGEMDAANVDLKGFTEGFYREVCGGALKPVLETLRHIRHETRCWLEITTLLIPGRNDGDAEVRAMSHWILEELGAEVPLHFTAFHPDYRMLDTPGTPSATLHRARGIALETGLLHVYTGNILDEKGGTTLCPGCGEALIVRRGYEIRRWELENGVCAKCGRRLAGRFESVPGGWGGGRVRVRMGGERGGGEYVPGGR